MQLLFQYSINAILSGDEENKKIMMSYFYCFTTLSEKTI